MRKNWRNPQKMSIQLHYTCKEEMHMSNKTYFRKNIRIRYINGIPQYWDPNASAATFLEEDAYYHASSAVITCFHNLSWQQMSAQILIRMYILNIVFSNENMVSNPAHYQKEVYYRWMCLCNTAQCGVSSKRFENVVCVRLKVLLH